jgi:ABC-type sugar transport system permease subunit
MNTVQILVHTQNVTTDAATALKARIARNHTERGEGVISAAIAVLIMATIGALMYLSYVNLFKSSARKTGQLVDLSTYAAETFK